MDLITGVRPRPAGYALWLAFVQPDVLQNRERLRVGLSAYSQRDHVCARIGAAPAPSSAEAAAASADQRLRTKVPVHPVDSLILRSVEGADRIPRGIGDRDLHITRRRRLQVVVDRRPSLRVFADERFLSSGLLSALTICEIRNRGTNVEEDDILGARRGH